MESEQRDTKHKGGRPPMLIKRSYIKGIRFTKEELEKIQQKANQARVTITEYIRQASLNGKMKSRLSEEEIHFVRQLIGISNNLNQVAKTGHEEGFSKAAMMFENYRQLIDELLEKLKND